MASGYTGKTVTLLGEWYVNIGGDPSNLRNQASGYQAEVNRLLQLILVQYGG